MADKGTSSLEIADVRRRVRSAMEAARKEAQERRMRSDQAARDYDAFLTDRAAPVFRVFVAALAAEGFRFQVSTPAGAVRLAADASPDDFLELTLDTSVDPPIVLGRTNRGRGRRLVTSEQPLNDRIPIAELTEEDVLAFLTRGIGPFVER